MFRRVRKVKDFTGFVSKLHEMQPTSILIEASREPARTTRHLGSVGRLGTYDHALLYTVRNGKKNRRYLEPLFRIFQSEWGFADALERNKRIMSVLLAGEKRVDYLREQLSGTLIQLGDGHGEPFKPEILDQLHEQAEEYGVEPAI